MSYFHVIENKVSLSKNFISPIFVNNLTKTDRKAKHHLNLFDKNETVFVARFVTMDAT